MSTEGSFLRARRPEQKQQRYQAILDAAREVALRDGMNGVSLATIAANVGIGKSALLTYFGTREEIYLRVAEIEWREWADAVVPVLDAGTGAEHVITRLGRSLTDHPLLCQLLIHTTLTLERNVSLDAVRSFKAATMRAVADVAAAVHRAVPALDHATCVELLVTTGLAAAGLWQAANPPPVVLELYAEQPVPPGADRFATLEFPDAVDRFLRVYLAGLHVCAPHTFGRSEPIRD